jgi:arginine deiminase
MSYDVYNVWDALYGVMCIPCPHRQWCHGDEEDANDQQMCICIADGQIVRIEKQVVQKTQIEDPLGDIDLTPIDEPRVR